jgi:hypothetical protein
MRLGAGEKLYGIWRGFQGKMAVDFEVKYSPFLC